MNGLRAQKTAQVLHVRAQAWWARPENAPQKCVTGGAPGTPLGKAVDQDVDQVAPVG
jgi:hypothetical protein